MRPHIVRGVGISRNANALEEKTHFVVIDVTKTSGRRTKHPEGIGSQDAEGGRPTENGNGPHGRAKGATRQSTKLAHSVIRLALVVTEADIHFAHRNCRGWDGDPTPRQEIRVRNAAPSRIVKNEIGRHKRQRRPRPNAGIGDKRNSVENMRVDTTPGALTVFAKAGAGVDTKKAPVGQSGELLQVGGRIALDVGGQELCHHGEHARCHRLLLRLRRTPIASLSKHLGEQRMPSLARGVDEQRRSNTTVQLQESGRRAQVSGYSLRLKIRTTLNVVPFGTSENKQR